MLDPAAILGIEIFSMNCLNSCCRSKKHFSTAHRLNHLTWCGMAHTTTTNTNDFGIATLLPK